MLESAIGPRTTVQSPLRWSDDPDWKGDYCNIARRSPEEVAALRAEAENARIVAKELREKELKKAAAGGTA